MKLEGLDQIRRRLSEISDKDGRRVMVAATRAGAVVARKEAKNAAPVRRSGGVRYVGEKKAGRRVRAPGFLQRQTIYRRKKGRNLFAFSVGPSRAAFYGAFLELGRKGGPSRASRAKKRRGTKPRLVPPMSPRPWLRPAWERSKRRVLDAVAAGFDKGFKKVGKGGN